MSHGRMYVFSNLPLTEYERQSIYEQVTEEKVPSTYDYVSDDLGFDAELQNFLENHPHLKHDGTKFDVSLGEALNDAKETHYFPTPSGNEMIDYLRFKYLYRYGKWSWESFVIVNKYKEDSFEWTWDINLFDALVAAYHYSEMRHAIRYGQNPRVEQGIVPLDLNFRYDLILEDVYDYHY